MHALSDDELPCSPGAPLGAAVCRKSVRDQEEGGLASQRPPSPVESADRDRGDTPRNDAEGLSTRPALTVVCCSRLRSKLEDRKGRRSPSAGLVRPPCKPPSLGRSREPNPRSLSEGDVHRDVARGRRALHRAEMLEERPIYAVRAFSVAAQPAYPALSSRTFPMLGISGVPLVRFNPRVDGVEPRSPGGVALRW